MWIIIYILLKQIRFSEVAAPTIQPIVVEVVVGIDVVVITQDKESNEETQWYGTKGNIQFIPLLKWLLKNGK
ncbi:MAG: hypothetical protein AABX52_03930 [Nanoarchaeota archaeon]